MSLFKVAASIAALSVLAAASPVQAQSFARQRELHRLQEQASDLTAEVLQSAESQDCSPRLPALRAIFNDPRFDRMEPEVRRPFLFALMVCAEVKDTALALAAATRLEPIASLPPELSAVYSIRVSDALQRGETAEAATRFLAFTDRAPEAAAAWDPEMVSAFAEEIPGQADLSRKLLKRLVELNWTNAASRRAARNDWALGYGRLLADAGQTRQAVEAVAKADDLYVLLMIAGDKRFAGAWPDAEKTGRFDWPAVAQKDLARARADMEALPLQLRPVQESIGLLRALGRHEEAIQMGQAYRARLEDGEAFDDAGAQDDLVLIALGEALFDTDQTAEAEAVFKTAIGEVPSRSLDAVMSWAGDLIDLGRGKDALALLDAIDRDYLTPYGERWLDSQRACAQAGIDPKAAAATVAELRKSRDDNPGALSRGLLCTNQVDEAGQLLAWRLRSPDHRAGGLDPYWITLPPPRVTPARAEFERRRQAMLAHPEARQALQAFGREVKADLTGDYWGGF